ncbi:Beta-barrel assembly-enhancing protease [Candidatus Entotheonellaceae bacterium PAL068K]
MSSIIATLYANASYTFQRAQVPVLTLLCIWCLWPMYATATRQAEPPEPQAIAPGDTLLERWQADAARQWAEQQLANEPEQPVWRFMLGQALFYLGRYSEALEAFDQAIHTLPHPRFEAYRGFVAQTVQSTATLRRMETPHFRIDLDPERDAALVPYIGDVLEQSYTRLGHLFELLPTEKIRVEIFPTPDTFYPASSLSARDIEVSGAIGICKFNKIMLLSPRNLARGYRWTDALSHEYIHYLLVHLSGNRAPIWLHEGIARYFENAWRLPQPAWLTRRTESLLAHALKHNSFVGFQNMEPSLVKLDTTYQVQLGYAEAASAIDFIMHRLGAAGLVRILRDLQQHQDNDATGAIARVMGLEFAVFSEQWQQFLAAKNLQEHAGVRLPRFELKDGDRLPVDDLHKEIQSSVARQRTRLGDRLRQRGRLRAATAEYRRALDKDPYSPYLLNKLASSIMAQGRWQRALRPLQRARTLAPDYVTTYTNLGRLHLALQEYEQARLALQEAIQINPFDPAIHAHLAESYRRLGQMQKAQQEQQLFERLQEMYE